MLDSLVRDKSAAAGRAMSIADDDSQTPYDQAKVRADPSTAKEDAALASILKQEVEIIRQAVHRNTHEWTVPAFDLGPKHADLKPQIDKVLNHVKTYGVTTSAVAWYDALKDKLQADPSDAPLWEAFNHAWEELYLQDLRTRLRPGQKPPAIVRSPKEQELRASAREHNNRKQERMQRHVLRSSRVELQLNRIPWGQTVTPLQLSKFDEPIPEEREQPYVRWARLVDEVQKYGIHAGATAIFLDLRERVGAYGDVRLSETLDHEWQKLCRWSTLSMLRTEDKPREFDTLNGETQEEFLRRRQATEKDMKAGNAAELVQSIEDNLYLRDMFYEAVREVPNDVMKADTAERRNAPKQGIWSGIKRWVAFQYKDIMDDLSRRTRADFNKQNDWLARKDLVLKRLLDTPELRMNPEPLGEAVLDAIARVREEYVLAA